MKFYHKRLIFFLISAGIAFFILSNVLAQNTVTIVGVVNSDFQIVTDNEEVYEIGEGTVGDELALLVNAKVKVTGTVTEVEGVKEITVIKYERIE